MNLSKYVRGMCNTATCVCARMVKATALLDKTEGRRMYTMNTDNGQMPTPREMRLSLCLLLPDLYGVSLTVNR